MSKPLSSRPSDEASPLLSRENADLSHSQPNLSNLRIFRRAVGIKSHLSPQDECNLEAGRATALGIYASTIAARRRLRTSRIAVSVLLYACHAVQLIVGAVLTAMGPSAGTHRLGITVLGAVNTVVAGILTLMKGKGLPEKLRRDEVEFRRLQDWIEETEALLVLSVVGGTKDEVGELVASAFRRWNLANAKGEDVRPEDYAQEADRGGNQGVTANWLRGR
ncbi:C6 transcription factor [Colletotrichum plurivorum]|uniref:C6 transcription factor n=1 Tax=Colletotrichum plurivorum TaxID=2175906 RepID=A0A8H6KQ77_9PEZI|nr:C6 transcription factor [Colletotrichum plurivorum]